MTAHGPRKPEQLSRAQVRAALRRSGYLLEGRTDHLLTSRGYHVSSNAAYPDPYTGKSRETDLYAWGSPQPIGDQPDTDDLIWAQLVVECVHPPQPIAFFTKPTPEEWDSGLERLKVAGHPIQQPDGDLRHNWYWLKSELQFNQGHHYFGSRVATQFCSFEKKKGLDEWMATHRDEDYDTFRKVAAAMDYFIRDTYSSMYE